METRTDSDPLETTEWLDSLGAAIALVWARFFSPQAHATIMES